MGRRGWLIAVAVGLVGVVLFSAKELGVFRTADDLDRAAEGVDPGVLGEPPFVAPEEEGADESGGQKKEKGEHSLALSGRATVILHDFAMNDKQGREVLRVQRMEGHVDVSALRRGVYRMRKTHVEGIEVTLYRDATGQVSLTHALGQTPAPVRGGLHMPPKKQPDDDPWLLEIGPVEVKDATLTLGFTEKPVQFQVEHAVIRVRRNAEDEGPMVFIEDVHGKMSKPKPLPKPVRIAFANGVVKLVGEPLVDLTARTCIGRDELRAHAVVPARKEAVTMTVDSQGLMGALGRMGLKIASRREREKLHYVHAPVKVEGGPGCKKKDSAKDDSSGATPQNDAEGSGASASDEVSADADTETRSERREERKERREE